MGLFMCVHLAQQWLAGNADGLAPNSGTLSWSPVFNYSPDIELIASRTSITAGTPVTFSWWTDGSVVSCTAVNNATPVESDWSWKKQDRKLSVGNGKRAYHIGFTCCQCHLRQRRRQDAVCHADASLRDRDAKRRHGIEFMLNLGRNLRG